MLPSTSTANFVELRENANEYILVALSSHKVGRLTSSITSQSWIGQPLVTKVPFVRASILRSGERAISVS